MQFDSTWHVLAKKERVWPHFSFSQVRLHCTHMTWHSQVIWIRLCISFVTAQRVIADPRRWSVTSDTSPWRTWLNSFCFSGKWQNCEQSHFNKQTNKLTGRVVIALIATFNAPPPGWRRTPAWGCQLGEVLSNHLYDTFFLWQDGHSVSKEQSCGIHHPDSCFRSSGISSACIICVFSMYWFSWAVQQRMSGAGLLYRRCARVASAELAHL